MLIDVPDDVPMRKVIEFAESLGMKARYQGGASKAIKIRNFPTEKTHCCSGVRWLRLAQTNQQWPTPAASLEQTK